jgi:hypothetical protein
MSLTKRISRRTVLRGLGAAVALPWLEAMMPQTSLGAAGAGNEAPPRMAFLFVPNGMHMPDWTPAEEGELKSLPSILQPLETHKAKLTVLSELTLNGGRALGDGPGDHARCVASYLTGAHPYKTDGKNIRNGISVDQVAAQAIGDRTRFASLELGCEPSAQAGRCDSGYSCIYTSNMSWRSETSPMAKEINPRAVFDRLFGSGDTQEDSKGRAKRDRYKKSILDLVAEDASALKRNLGAADRQKLEEYLYAVRQIERRVEESERLIGREDQETVPDFPRPAGVPKAFDDHVRLMMDMMVLAWATDATRILTFMYTNAGSNRSYPDIGVRQGHHAISHHGKDPKKQADISKINRHHVTLLKYFLDRLESIEETGGTLLDHSMIVYGSGLGDGNRHNHDDLPILLAGRGCGTIRPGRHLRYPDETPLTNLYLALLHRMGVHENRFSDSTGVLEGLS